MTPILQTLDLLELHYRFHVLIIENAMYKYRKMLENSKIADIRILFFHLKRTQIEHSFCVGVNDVNKHSVIGVQSS